MLRRVSCLIDGKMALKPPPDEGRRGWRLGYGLMNPEMTVMDASTRMTLKMTPTRGSATCRLLEASSCETVSKGAMLM